MQRSNYNGLLTINDINKNVILIGWVAKKRNLGSIIFIDLRDKTGTIQVVVKKDIIIPEINNEYIIQVYGTIVKKKNILDNKNKIEVIAKKINIINTAKTLPINIDDNTNSLEDLRLKYRYLDLRRPINQKRLFIRAKIVKLAHEFLDENNFLEIETPILTLSTPEGARDYLVPSRIHQGCFYALPQSPQIYKQLLMISGFERYYQIAKCFRDEDLRADRQPDFTQIDIEASFLDENEIMTLMEQMIAKIFKNILDYDVELPLKKIKYDDAIDIYGSDKPDTRFNLKLIDIKEIFNPFFKKKNIKAIIIPNFADKITNIIIKELKLQAKKFNIEKYIILKIINNNFDKNLFDKNVFTQLQKKTKFNNNDVIIIAADDDYYNVCFALGELRKHYAKKLNLIDNKKYDLLWINNFPLFEINKKNEIKSLHHPFTRPKDEDLPFLETNPLKVKAYAYDMIINGYEVGGGSLRIYKQDIQKKIFKILKLNDNDIKQKFGFFIDAFAYGTPPHGGIAFGLERLTMILSNTDNIRDVIAFPKNLSAVCPMSNSPSFINNEQLKELGITIIKKRRKK